ncbi:MAG: hypothetical protein WBM04_20515 [Candidatus Korobacteraceae bacterium]
MKTRVGLALLILLAIPLLAQTDTLRPQTLAAWNEYLRATNARLEHDVRQKNSFLLIDHDPGLSARLRGGAVVVSPACNNGHAAVPHGLITDWVGDVFVPNAKIGEVLAQLVDYDRYGQFFNPTVADAHLLSHAGDEYNFSMVLRQRVLFLTPVLDGDYQLQITKLDERRWYTISHTTRLQDVENYGELSQRKLPPDQGHGYIWRIYNITRFEERDGGVYIEMEAIALSRDVPVGLRWLIDPVVRYLPKNSLTATLSQTRDAVTVPNRDPGMFAQYEGAAGSK